MCHTGRSCLVIISERPERKRNMTPKIDLFAAAPSWMKDYQRASIALDSASRLEPGLAEVPPQRASDLQCRWQRHTSESRDRCDPLRAEHSFETSDRCYRTAAHVDLHRTARLFRWNATTRFS